eukprot:CAMPEP_0197696734 /NCGR_PEP_ID=MMETSP1338-20131121/117028_1 /TAXON_ID=43686 ORGANISM="Pelagodinium beii, Strain RCC1491" /NCGR_SAMPLE_ID=MMETSP1338 /ASSEMBLY_ACC=CAM_ASM_000754 /LENGTH=108 /DNA_ID=CAMNT_0043279887 /DNA_START=27 /DNA_END=350 /DNA_ORIENTATION=+
MACSGTGDSEGASTAAIRPDSIALLLRVVLARPDKGTNSKPTVFPLAASPSLSTNTACSPGDGTEWLLGLAFPLRPGGEKESRPACSSSSARPLCKVPWGGRLKAESS